MLEQSFAFFPPLVLGSKSVWKNKHRWTQNSEKELKLQEALSGPPNTFFCLCDSLSSLFFLPSTPYPHTPTLECTNPLWSGLWQKSPLKSVSRNMAAQCGGRDISSCKLVLLVALSSDVGQSHQCLWKKINVFKLNIRFLSVGLNQKPIGKNNNNKSQTNKQKNNCEDVFLPFLGSKCWG